MVQLSHPYMTTGKTISLTIQIFVDKALKLQINISPSNGYLELISFRINWFDLLAVQGTLKNLLQHRNSKASVLWHAAFFMVQLAHSYMTVGKIIALTIWTFVSKVMSLLLNMCLGLS